MRWTSLLVLCAGFASFSCAQIEGEESIRLSFTSYPNTTMSIPSNATTTGPSTAPSTAPSTTAPPPEPSTSYLTLDVSGSTRTVIFTNPNEPGKTIEEPTATSVDPSLITSDPNAGSQTTVSRSAMALLGLSALFAAFA